MRSRCYKLFVNCSFIGLFALQWHILPKWDDSENLKQQGRVAAWMYLSLFSWLQGDPEQATFISLLNKLNGLSWQNQNLDLHLYHPRQPWKNFNYKQPEGKNWHWVCINGHAKHSYANTVLCKPTCALMDKYHCRKSDLLSQIKATSFSCSLPRL